MPLKYAKILEQSEYNLSIYAHHNLNQHNQNSILI